MKTAQDVLPRIRAEDAYRDAENELGLLLTGIAEDLIKQIRRHPEQSLGRPARAALALVERFVPEEAQPKERMAEAAASLTFNEREVGRNSGTRRRDQRDRRRRAERRPRTSLHPLRRLGR